MEKMKNRILRMVFLSILTSCGLFVIIYFGWLLEKERDELRPAWADTNRHKFTLDHHVTYAIPDEVGSDIPICSVQDIVDAVVLSKSPDAEFVGVSMTVSIQAEKVEISDIVFGYVSRSLREIVNPPSVVKQRCCFEIEVPAIVKMKEMGIEVLNCTTISVRDFEHIKRRENLCHWKIDDRTAIRILKDYLGDIAIGSFALYTSDDRHKYYDGRPTWEAILRDARRIIEIDAASGEVLRDRMLGSSEKPE